MHSFGQQTLHVTFSQQSHWNALFCPAGCLFPAASGPLLERARLNSLLPHQHSHRQMLPLLLLCLLYSWKWHCYCTKKNHFNSFKKRVKTLAFICKALYLGPCCLHVLYRWFHVYIRPHFLPNSKLGFRFCSDIEFNELSSKALALLDSPVTVRNVFKCFIYLLPVRQMSPRHHCRPTYSTSPHSSEHFSQITDMFMLKCRLPAGGCPLPCTC